MFFSAFVIGGTGGDLVGFMGIALAFGGILPAYTFMLADQMVNFNPKLKKNCKPIGWDDMIDLFEDDDD